MSQTRQESHLSTALMDIQEVATLLKCSIRHIYRLIDTGRIPRPVKLGALVRWRRSVMETWLADGCPDCRKGGRC